MRFCLEGKEVTFEELVYAFNGLLNGTYCKQTIEIKDIENGDIYFTIVNHAV